MDDKIRTFIENLLPAENEIEQELRNYAKEYHVPILRRDAAAFLRTIVSIKKPMRILEVGTAIGYSALIMSHAAPFSHIDTVEIDMDSVVLARQNIKKAGKENQIRVIAGDGNEVLAALTKPYDMIFMDAAKGQYIYLYDDVLRLLKEGGLLLCDNCIFYGKVLDKPEETNHKHRTIVTNMRAFLERMMADRRLEASLLDVGDGMAVACKKF
jgi:predicted O-methyltransferase YrrM